MPVPARHAGVHAGAGMSESSADFLARLHRGLARLEAGLICLLLLALMVLGLLQWFVRHFDQVRVTGLDDLIAAVLLWLIMLSGALGASRLNHPQLFLALKGLPAVVREWIGRLVLLVTAGVCLVMTWHTLNLAALEFGFQTTLPGGLPNWLVMMILPVGFGMMAARFAAHALSPWPSATVDDETGR